MSINMALAVRLGFGEKRVAKIVLTQALAEACIDEMRRLSPTIESRSTFLALAKSWTSTQFILQALWKFPEDARFHRFWELPHCACPKVDNEERWGTDWTIRASQCPLHGEEMRIDEFPI